MNDLPWLVTWTTYGAWLPGDPRGFRTRRGQEYVPPPARFAHDGEKTYDPKDYAARYANAKEMVPQAVRLTAEEQKLACKAIVTELATLGILVDIIAVDATHVHLIARFGLHWIRPTVGRLKAAATRDLPNPGDRKRIWTKNCHMKSLGDGTALQNAAKYVRRHGDEGAVIWEPTTEDAADGA